MEEVAADVEGVVTEAKETSPIPAGSRGVVVSIFNAGVEMTETGIDGSTTGDGRGVVKSPSLGMEYSTLMDLIGSSGRVRGGTYRGVFISGDAGMRGYGVGNDSGAGVDAGDSSLILGGGVVAVGVNGMSSASRSRACEDKLLPVSKAGERETSPVGSSLRSLRLCSTECWRERSKPGDNGEWIHCSSSCGELKRKASVDGEGVVSGSANAASGKKSKMLGVTGSESRAFTFTSARLETSSRFACEM